MNLRGIGLTLLLISLILGALMLADVKIPKFERKADYVRTEDNKPLIDRVVQVPPWNSTEGWVGFNITLRHKEKVNYEAYGLILPNDAETNPEPPDIAMRVVNETGLALLLFEQFDPPVWNDTKVYAEADLLPPNKLHDNFKFHDLDESEKYIVLFRNYKNSTQPRPILINIKESWDEITLVSLLEPKAPYIVIAVLTTITGLGLLTRKPKPPRRRRLLKRGSAKTFLSKHLSIPLDDTLYRLLSQDCLSNRDFISFPQ